MPNALLLASGGKLLLSGGGSLLLSGPLFRTAQTANGQAISLDATSNAIGQAITQAGFGQAGAVAFDAQSLIEGINLTLGAITADGQAFDSSAIGQGTTNTTAQTAQALLESFLTSAQAEGTLTLACTGAELQALIYEAIATLQGAVTVQPFEANTQSEAQAVTAIAIGTALLQTLQADGSSQATDANASIQGIAQVLAENVQAIAEAYEITAFIEGLFPVLISDVPSASIIASRIRALRDGALVRFVPITPSNVRAIRNPSQTQITLTWTDEQGTESIVVQRSLGDARESMSDYASVAKGVETYTDAVSSEHTVSYRLIAIGETGLRSVPSKVVYSTPNSAIF